MTLAYVPLTSANTDSRISTKSLTIFQRSGPQYCGSSQKVNSSMTAGQNKPRMEKQTAPTSEMKGSRSGRAMAIRTATYTNALTLINLRLC